jgi:hypothetical protein
MELLVPIALIAAGGFILGAVVGRWFIVAVAALPWPVGLIGTWIGLWGNGLDHDTARWFIVTVVGLYALAGAVGATVGVLARKRYGKRHRLSPRRA